MTRKQILIDYINELKADKSGIEVFINDARISYCYSGLALDDAIEEYESNYTDDLFKKDDKSVQVVYYTSF